MNNYNKKIKVSNIITEDIIYLLNTETLDNAILAFWLA